ncbi:AAA family ATPase [Rubrivivax sp. RP6-9]|uniref:AAA family ATPase n=1 Tax=Rubrivivax sp. RP6-9 TaxID=3415750 RepID=UPI003CC5A117
MEPAIKIVLAVVRAIFSPVRRLFMKRRAEMTAAKVPEKFKSLEQSHFDDVLGRIAAANPDDSIFKIAADATTNRFFTPEFLRTTSVQAWLAEPEVRRGLSSLAMARLVGSPELPEVRSDVEARYRTAAMANAQESAAVVSSAVAMFAAGVKASVSDPGTSVLVAGVAQDVQRGFATLNARLDRESVRDSALAEHDALKPLDDLTAKAWRDAFSKASTALKRWPTTVGDGTYISRPELGELQARAQSKEPGVVALLGAPGSGKSALLAKLAQDLSVDEKVAVLAIKGDVLEPEVESEEGLQRCLRLPELPSIMLRRLALRGPVALLIDQLDALAGHLDAKTGRLSVLLNLVKAVSSTEGVFVLVSCRSFEFTHDIRLSHIEATSLTLQLPPWEDVLPVLEAHGVQAAGLNSDAKEVLRAPQHLSTFLQLRAAGVHEPVSNYTAMLNSLWSVRVLAVPGADELARLAFEIAETMAEKEVLWLAAARFDDRAKDAFRLEAAGILTKSDQGAIGFSHQTVFEHVLARSFAKTEGRLSTYVLARNDSLFVRPKAWAALAYLRDAEQESYEVELSAIWSAPGLRKHLRFLLVEFMGSQPQPTDKEELLLATAGEEPNLLPFVLKAIAGSPGWFSRFGANLIAQAMGDSRTADLCVPILEAAWAFAPDRVSELVLEHWVAAEANDRRTLYVLEGAPQWTPALIEAAKRVVVRSQLQGFHADHFVSTVGAREPVVAIELLRHVLEAELTRRIAEANRLQKVADEQRPAEGEPDLSWHIEHSPHEPLENLLSDRQSWGSVPALAAAAPREFVEVLWPWYVRAFRSLLELSATEPPYLSFPLPYRADFRFEGEDRNSLEPPALLEAIATAVEELAKTAPHELAAWAKEQESIDLAPVQRLIAHALAANPSATASTALSFLLGDERRYFLGGVSDSSSTTRSLISACASTWSPEEVARYVQVVKSYSPVRPQDVSAPDEIKHWHRMVKRRRQNLLDALPVDVRPEEVQRELDEARRAFPQRDAPEDFTSGWVGARMNSDQFAKASTEDIVNAFKEIPDASAWDHPRHFGRGGNIQLSREFAEFAKKDTTRAVELMQHLPPDCGQRAVGYAIDALAEVLPPDQVMSLIGDAHRRGFDSPEFRQSAAHAVDRLLNRDARISDEHLSMLEQWLPTEALAARESSESTDSAEDAGKDEGFLLSGHPRMRVVPSGDYPILSSLVRARFARDELADVVGVLSRYLDTSLDTRVWECMADLMPRLAWEESGRGRALIGEVLSRVPLEGTRSAAVLMAKTHSKALEEVLAVLPSWRRSPKVAAQKGYGELVALIALVNPAAQQARLWLDELLATPDATLARAGATATVVQLLWPEVRFRPAATDLLLQLLAKNEAAIWREVFGLFSLVDKLEPETQTVRLVEGIAQQIDRAPPPSEPHVVERLAGLVPRHAETVARIATQLVQLWRDQLTNAGSSLVGAGQDMMDLALTLHRTEGTKLEGLQMFEQLVEIDAYQAREVLDELDHRVRLGGRPLRPRLRRRGRRRKAVAG